MDKAKKKKLIIKLTVAAVVVVLMLTAVPFAVSGIVYSAVFGSRCETADYLRYSVSDFDGLVEERVTFKSGATKLQGYVYSAADIDPKGVVVICHGFGGGGCNQYMDSAYVFVKNGYYTFMFDATGCDLSEGNGTGGFPQFTLDLNAAIDYVKSNDRFGGLPVMLLGHSMGGFAALSVLNLRSDIAAVAALSAFCESADMIALEGEAKAGKISLIFMPYVRLFELVKFGGAAAGTAITGLRKTDCPVMIVHSEDDKTVPIRVGYDKLINEFGGDERFTFIKYKDKGHDFIDHSDEAIEYIGRFNEAYAAWFNETSPDSAACAEYIRENLDRSVWNDLLDEELYRRILEMFNSAAENGGE